LYAEFLEHAGQLIDRDLSEAAGAYMGAAERWLDVGEVCRSVPAVDEATRLSRVRRDAVERGDVGDQAALEAAEGIAGVLDSARPIGPEEMADLFSNFSEAIHAAANAERGALDMLRVAMA
jgi:hypothetical protein